MARGPPGVRHPAHIDWLHSQTISLWIHGLGVFLLHVGLLYLRVYHHRRRALHASHPQGLAAAHDSWHRLHAVLLLGGGWRTGMGLVSVTRHAYVLYLLDRVGHQ